MEGHIHENRRHTSSYDNHIPYIIDLVHEYNKDMLDGTLVEILILILNQFCAFSRFFI
jgi:hypothetical protein